MNKEEFLSRLCSALSGLPEKETADGIAFYSELLDDMIESGLSEEAAVAAVGSPEKNAEQIIGSTPLTKIVKEKLKKKRRLKALEIALIAAGSPIWLSLTVSAFAVVLSLYIAVWSVTVALWAAFVSIIGSAVGGICGGFLLMLTENLYSGIALIGAALVLFGLSVFAFYGCKAATKGIILLTKKLLLWIKKTMIGREASR